jgi:Protein of unknown function (DUF3467)
MANQSPGELMDRIDRLERANKFWRIISVSLAGTVVVASFAYAMRDVQKGQPGVEPGPRPLVNQPMGPAAIGSEPSLLPVTYTNFVRVSVTPEELALDLGLNLQMDADPNQQFRASNRIVMSFYTAKRMSHALQQVVQQYEAVYGPVELDFNKRVLPGAKLPNPK